MLVSKPYAASLAIIRSSMTRVATHINEIESHAHLTHCHGYALQLVLGETIKATEVMRGTIDGDILINKLRINILTSCVYRTSYVLQVIFITWFTSYFLYTSYELQFIARFTSYFLHIS